MSIEFKIKQAPNVAVYLAGKQVGTIMKLAYGAGWQYAPKGSKERGDTHPTLADCKQSLGAA